MSQKVFEVNPIAGTVKIAGFDFCEDKTWDLQEFKQMCFENNWEGTLHRVLEVERATEEWGMTVMFGPHHREVAEAVAEAGKRTGRKVGEVGMKKILQKIYPDDWQKYCKTKEAAT